MSHLLAWLGRLGNGPVSGAAGLDSIAIDARCPLCDPPALAGFLLAVVVDVFEVVGVEVAW